MQKYNNFIIENVNYKYNIGDYVLLDLDKVNKEWKIMDDNGNFLVDDSVLITDISETNYYEVQFYDLGYLHIRQSNIIRQLTSEEIKNYKIKENSLKYNL